MKSYKASGVASITTLPVAVALDRSTMPESLRGRARAWKIQTIYISFGNPFQISLAPSTRPRHICRSVRTSPAQNVTTEHAGDLGVTTQIGTSVVLQIRRFGLPKEFRSRSSRGTCALACRVERDVVEELRSIFGREAVATCDGGVECMVAQRGALFREGQLVDGGHRPEGALSPYADHAQVGFARGAGSRRAAIRVSLEPRVRSLRRRSVRHRLTMPAGMRSRQARCERC